jgi:hypothetical protein
MVVDEFARKQQAREIELELIRVRAAAEAARLEARAAELELMLRRMARGEDAALSSLANQFAAGATSDLENAGTRNTIADSYGQPRNHSHSGASSGSSPFAVAGDFNRPSPSEPWAGRLQRLHHRETGPAAHSLEAPYASTGWPSIPDGPIADVPSRSESPLWTPRIPAVPVSNPQELKANTTASTWSRIDPPQQHEVAHPHYVISDSPTHRADDLVADANALNEIKQDVSAETDEIEASLFETIVPCVVDSDTLPATQAAATEDIETPQADVTSPTALTTLSPEPVPLPKIVMPGFEKKPLPVALPAVQLNGEDEQEDGTGRRFRPASWFVSTVAHCGILVLLGFMTLTTTKPKDQMAFTSSVSESTEQAMETFEIESSEPMEPSEPVPSETAYEISDMGTMAVTEVSMDIPPAAAALNTAELMNSSTSSLSSSAMKSLKGEAMAATQFCGVDGGGSHFVYLVDSSGSMGDGFQSARTELLNSIDQLKPDQRFYVVFFDEEPDYMRLMDPNENDTASVMATPQNKQRLRKWAMTVEMNKGKAPYEVLPFALSLRPDVIFLLSDGEFPSAIEEILREQNREENLFGESGPISLVHTIRYHGREGQEGQNAEATMVKIAKENGGQYRHVPKPKASKR